MGLNGILGQLFVQRAVENLDCFLVVAGFHWIVCLEAQSQVAQAVLKFSISLRMNLNPNPLASTFPGLGWQVGTTKPDCRLACETHFVILTRG